MASSYTGDPSWLPNNPFLNMLAALEDQVLTEEQQPGSSNVMQQQQPVHREDRQAKTVKLPEFWAHSPGIWFARAELRFQVCGVTSEMEKFAYAANVLQYESLRLVTDLVRTRLFSCIRRCSRGSLHCKRPRK